jgi:glycosyltransferase involved in cell wall biosynthesis
MSKIINPLNLSINKKNPKISMVFSLFNEENNLPTLIKTISKIFNELLNKKLICDYELIFVNDSSSDGSEKIIHNALKKNSKIILINTSRNFGNTECILAGFKYCTGDAALYMDCDLQDPPELIPKMIHMWKNDNDAEVIYTTRLSREDESFLKLFITKYGYKLINYITPFNIPVDSGDFKLISKNVIHHLLKMNDSFPFLRGMISFIGYKQIQIKYNRRARYDGRENTKYPIFSRRVLSGYIDRALISFSILPLKLIFIIGLIFFFISFFLIFYFAYLKVISLAVPGWAGVMIAVTFFGSLNLVFIGIIGFYLGNIFYQTKARPEYIVKNIIINDEKKL